MSNHTITITLDVPDGMAAAIHDMAHRAIIVLGTDTDAEIQSISRALNLISFAFDNKPLPLAQSRAKQKPPPLDSTANAADAPKSKPNNSPPTWGDDMRQ